MNEYNQKPNNKWPTFRDILWYLVLLPLLIMNILVGLYIILFKTDGAPLLFAIGVFTVAYAFHIFSVSAALCGIEIKTADPTKFDGIRKIEKRIVTYAMLVLAGGLTIILTASLCLLKFNFAIWIYCLGIFFQLCGFCLM